MSNDIINLSFLQSALAYVFILILLFIVKLKGISREKEIIVASIRMTVQLIITGNILAYVFERRNPWFTIIIIVIMEAFAVSNTYKRAKVSLTPQLRRLIAFSLVIGSTVCLLYFLIVVVQLKPWYEPRYFIPIAGMIVGNAMTGISLGTNRLVEGMNSSRERIEAALMLGATPKAASKSIINNAFDSAILPTINSMVGMGIVSLPGMMTGQILSGTSPLIAIEYQIAIMLGICGSVSLTVILFVQLGYKAFFNSRSQLKDE